VELDWQKKREVNDTTTKLKTLDIWYCLEVRHSPTQGIEVRKCIPLRLTSSEKGAAGMEVMGRGKYRATIANPRSVTKHRSIIIARSSLPGTPITSELPSLHGNYIPVGVMTPRTLFILFSRGYSQSHLSIFRCAVRQQRCVFGNSNSHGRLAYRVQRTCQHYVLFSL